MARCIAMTELPDQQLVDALNRGDVRAFDAIYHRYRDWVVRLAVRFTGHEDDALDAIEGTWKDAALPVVVAREGDTLFVP